MRKGRVSILFGGLAGFISVALVQLLATEKLDQPLNNAVVCFSIALPLTVFYVISAQDHMKDGRNQVPKLYEWVAIATILTSAVGLFELFRHFGFVPAVLFIVTAFLATIAANFLDIHPKLLSKSKKPKSLKK